MGKMLISQDIIDGVLEDFTNDPNTTYMDASRKWDISRETVKNILYRAGFKLPSRRPDNKAEHTLCTQERNERNGVSSKAPTELTRSL